MAAASRNSPARFRETFSANGSSGLLADGFASLVGLLRGGSSLNAAVRAESRIVIVTKLRNERRLIMLSPTIGQRKLHKLSVGTFDIKTSTSQGANRIAARLVTLLSNCYK